MTSPRLTAAGREALRRLSLCGGRWVQSYVVDIAGPTLARLHAAGLVDAKRTGESATHWRLNDAGKAALQPQGGDH